MDEAGALILGWEEWVAIPDLGLPSIKAKVDTGAKTSALHAHFIEPFGSKSQPMVRFVVHPVPGKEHIEVICSAPIVDRREVTSSNGDSETRYVIQADLEIADRAWPIDITLTNRANMAYRMLLGRQAIREDVFVDPTASFRQPRLSYKPYKKMPRAQIVSRPLRIGILTRKPDAPSVRKLREAAQARGHVIEVIDLEKTVLSFEDGIPGMTISGTRGPHYDAVIPRVGEHGQAYAAATVRQLELMGGFALNPGDALDTLREPLTVLQKLVRGAVPVRYLPQDERSHGPGLQDPAMAPGRELLVVGRRVIATREGNAASASEASMDLAAKAAHVLGLELVSIMLSDDAVTAIDAVPLLSRFRATGSDTIAEAIIQHVEANVRSWSRETDAATVKPPTTFGP